MKRLGIFLCCAVLFASFTGIAVAEEMLIADPLFIPRAYVDDDGTVMDANRWIYGKVNSEGTILDNTGNHIGFITSTGDIKDVHFTILASIDENGVVTDPEGNVLAHITEATVTDGAGRRLFKLDGAFHQPGLLSYLFFFSDTF
ncbi:MAG: DUF3659 domain-containing protein [Deltaproteobacteria bacterium]|nr:DUF3659 domain-containing protein [Candidatus Zymogenaceae bacterium]